MILSQKEIRNKFWELVYSGEIEVINNQNFDYIIQRIYKEYKDEEDGEGVEYEQRLANKRRQTDK